MLIKMKESKGFTLVELMIVVAIIGILAAVAVPFYQRYVQKSRLTSLVFPALHSIQTNIAAFYAVRNTFPDDISGMTADADMSYIKDARFNGDSARLTITINGRTALKQLDNKNLTAKAITRGGKITTWELGGTLADELGLK